MARLDALNARLGARRARLAGPGALREMLARPSLDARLELLRSLPLGASLAAASGPDAIGAAERALRDGLRREALALVQRAEGTRARALLVAFLGLEEAAAVKAILRGVARGAPLERTLATAAPVPALPEAVLRRAAAASSLGAAVDALAAAGSDLAAALREATGEGLLPLEIAADRAAILRARSACGRGEDGAVLARHLSDRADARNAATLVALEETPPAAAPWVPGGSRWREDDLDQLARAGLQAARRAVAEAFPGVGPLLGSAWGADRALESAVLGRLRREARARPLSIAVPLAYLAARREEVRRVALVLRGAAMELPGDELLDLVEA